MNFIILGDKFQKRMKSKGCVGLININDKPIIYHQYRNIKKAFPKAKIIYVSGFEHKRFSSYIEKNKENYVDIFIVSNKNFDKYNYAYTLSLVNDYLDSDCIIGFGDNIYKNTFNKLNTNNGSQIFINNKQKSSLGCIISDHQIQNISYDLDNYLMDIYYLSARHSAMLKKIVSNKYYENHFLFELINSIIDQKEIFKPLMIG